MFLLPLPQSSPSAPFFAPTSPQCLLESWGGARYTCYRPSGIHRAELQLSFHPFNVQTVVKHRTGLGLSQVIVFKGSEDHPLRRGNGIDYIFGKSSTVLVPYPSPPQPKWLILTEVPLKGKDTGSQQGWSVTGGEVSSSPAVTGTVLPWSNPWTVIASLPSRRIGIRITSNEDRNTTEQIASALANARWSS